jgi:hypothetical protein
MLSFAASFKESEPSHALFLFGSRSPPVRYIITTYVRMDTAREVTYWGGISVENDDHEVVGIICIITSPCFLYFLLRFRVERLGISS